jgi:hypothetical protein
MSTDCDPLRKAGHEIGRHVFLRITPLYTERTDRSSFARQTRAPEVRKGPT